MTGADTRSENESEERKANVSRVCNGDWMGLRTGMRVRRKDDGCHEGRLEAIHHGAYVKVKWDGTPPLIEDMIPLDDVERIRAPWEAGSR